MGNEAVRDPNYKAAPEQVAQMKHLLKEALDAGGFSFSATFSMANRDYDRGSIEWTMGHALQELGLDFLLELAKTSGRRVNWNVIISDPTNPNN
jgi:N-acyl-D-aspartate/D-glutamate deacylase